MTSKSHPITIANDPRFHLARTLISSSGDGNSSCEGGPNAAIDIFATLLEECRRSFGETSLDAALCQYEYGNALFRAAIRNNASGVEEHGQEDETKPAAVKSASAPRKQREVVAAAAEKRLLPDDKLSSKLSSKKPKVSDASMEKKPPATIENCASKNDDYSKADNDESVQLDGRIDGAENDDDEDDDVASALDMMETSFAILESHLSNDDAEEKKSDKPQQNISQQQREWALSQLPRVLIGIGDVYSFLENFGNAVDTYCRALPYRENAWKKLNGGKEKTEMLTLDCLQCQRHLVETYALVAEALVSCPEGEDVVCEYDDEGVEQENDRNAAVSKEVFREKTHKESGSSVLVKASERLNFAQSHYDLAREGLEEIIYRMGKMAATKVDVGGEKQDICYLVTTLVGIGNALAEAGGKE